MMRVVAEKDDRYFRKKVISLIFMKLRINYFEDQYQFKFSEINANREPVSCVFGKNFEVVFHSEMSLRGYMRCLSGLLYNMTKIDHDPFTGDKMDFFSYCCFHSMRQKLLFGIIDKGIHFTKRAPISRINWMEPYLTNDEDDNKIVESIYEALDDPRDCTMKIGFYIG